MKEAKSTEIEPPKEPTNTETLAKSPIPQPTTNAAKKVNFINLAEEITPPKANTTTGNQKDKYLNSPFYNKNMSFQTTKLNPFELPKKPENESNNHSPETGKTQEATTKQSNDKPDTSETDEEE